MSLDPHTGHFDHIPDVAAVEALDHARDSRIPGRALQAQHARSAEAERARAVHSKLQHLGPARSCPCCLRTAGMSGAFGVGTARRQQRRRLADGAQPRPLDGRVRDPLRAQHLRAAEGLAQPSEHRAVVDDELLVAVVADRRLAAHDDVARRTSRRPRPPASARPPATAGRPGSARRSRAAACSGRSRARPAAARRRGPVTARRGSRRSARRRRSAARAGRSSSSPARSACAARPASARPRRRRPPRPSRSRAGTPRASTCRPGRPSSC